MKRQASRRGLGMAEAVLSTVLVAVLLTAALRTAGASAVSQAKSADRARSILMAQALMEEILVQPYKDPGASPVFGLEAGETLGQRATYDDVDDYNGLNETTPKTRDGAALTAQAGWSRITRVEWVAASTLGQATGSASETGVKRITVTVYRRGAMAAKLTAIRTNA